MTHRRTTPKIFYRAKELRLHLTPAERKLWKRLRDRQLGGLNFRRQHAIGSYIVDFVCLEKKHVVELDGDSHANQPEYDAQRTAWLEEHGYQVQRFMNTDVNKNIDAVLQAILDACAKTPPPAPPHQEVP
jgi:very-short-patch-repair endonuclease